jgi:hypothetical protein
MKKRRALFLGSAVLPSTSTIPIVGKCATDPVAAAAVMAAVQL